MTRRHRPAVTALVMAWHFAATREPRWAIYSAGVGLLIIAFFIASTTVSVMDAKGTWQNAPTGFFQRLAIIGGWTWIAMVARYHLRDGGRKTQFRGATTRTKVSIREVQ